MVARGFQLVVLPVFAHAQEAPPELAVVQVEDRGRRLLWRLVLHHAAPLGAAAGLQDLGVHDWKGREEGMRDWDRAAATRCPASAASAPPPRDASRPTHPLLPLLPLPAARMKSFSSCHVV